MKPRRAAVHYTLHPTPFEIEFPELSFPTRPEEQELHRQAEDLLSKARWSYHDDKTKKTTAAATRMLAPDDLAGDVLLVMVRICEAPAESIEQRCTTLRIDRAREFRARAELESHETIYTQECDKCEKYRHWPEGTDEEPRECWYDWQAKPPSDEPDEDSDEER